MTPILKCHKLCPMTKQTFITEEGLLKLQDELQYLKTTKRKEIAERIATAKELGDLSENAEYSEAKDDQVFVESRIAELEAITRSVQIIKKPRKGSSRVQIGSTVEVEDASGTLKKFTIVGSNEADPASGKISNESPLGQSLLGKNTGEVAEIQAPRGTLQFKVVKIV